MPPLIAVAALWLAALTLTGGYFDLRYRQLPNWLSLLCLVSGLACVLALTGWQDVPSSLLHGVMALLVGIGLFAMGGIGGGDAKFYAALATWFPLRDAPALLAAVSVAGLLIVACWFLWRARLSRKGRRQVKGTAFDGVPYGVAISLGAMTTFALTH